MAQNNWLDEGSTPVPQPTSAAADTSWLDEQSDVVQDNALVRGFKKSSQSIGITKGLVTGDSADTARKVAEAADYARKNPGMQEGRELGQAWDRGDGVWGGIKEVAGEFAKDWRDAPGAIAGVRATGRNLLAMGEKVIEQVPNMAAPVAGMIAGGAAGSAAAGPVGTVLGGWAGASLGNTAVEGGSMVQEALQKHKINPTDQAAVSAYLEKNGDRILGQAGVKGAIIGAVDTATAGLGHFLLSGPGKAAASRALADMGVDAADKAAVRAAQSSAAFKNRIASDAAYQATQQGANKIARNAGAAALEPAGEFAGEFVGQGVATGEWDTKNAALEAASSIGQSGAMYAGQKAIQAFSRPGAATNDPSEQPVPAPGQPPAPPPAPNQGTGPTLALPAPDRGVIQVAGDGTARTPAYQAPGYVGDVTDVEPRAVNPVREQVAAAAEQGGALSSAALTAIDTGVTQAMQPAPEQAPPQISLEEADARDQAAYEQHWDSYDSDPVVSRYFEDDSDIPDFGAASNVSDEEFLRSLGATDEDIQDAIATARQSPIPQSSPAVDAGAQANEPAGPREGAGGNQAAPGQVTPRQPDNFTGTPSATMGKQGATARPGPGFGLKDALAQIRAKKQQEAANAQAAAPQAAPAAQSVPVAGTGSVEAAGFDQLEDALFKERNATTSAIENDWMNGNGRRHLTNIERAIYDAVSASTLDADNAAQIIETALENDRPDLAQYAASRAMRAAESMDTTPGVPQSSPKYGKIKSDLEARKKQALDAASALQEIVSSKQAPQAAAAAQTLPAARPGAVEAAGPATIPATTGVARESQASQAQQGSTQSTQAGGPQAGAATATASASPAGGNRVQAAGLTNGAPTQNTGAQGTPAASAQGSAPAEPEFTTIKTVYGDSVTVRTADLNSDKPRLRQYTKDGKSKAVPAIHRDNLDLTGEKSAERAKENAKNLLFHTVTTKDGGAFASQAAAQREVNRLGLQDSHEVVEAGGGFVGRIKKTGEQHGATARNLRLADERTPGAGAAAPHGPGESVAGEAPVVGAGQRQQAQAAAGNAAKPANLFSDPRTGAPVVVQNKATADAMARSKQLSGKVAVRKATPAEMADERNAFTGYNAGENRRIGYVLEMLPPKDAPATHAVTDRDNAQDKADAFIKTLTSKDGDASAPVAEPPAPAGRTYLAVPFNEKDYAKRAGAKWDEGKKLWYADPVGGDGAAAGEININLKQYVPQDSTKDDRYNYYGDKALATAVALNASARDGVQYDTIKRKHPDGIMMWSVVKAGEQTQAESAEKTSAATENVAQTITAADVQADTPKLTQAEAKALMEWQDLGQKNGVKTHILTFYESKADKDAKRGRMTIATVTKGDRSANNWTVEGDDKPLAVLGMAKKRAEDAGMAKLVADGFVAQEGNTAPEGTQFPMQEAVSSYAGISHRGQERAQSDADEFERFISAQQEAGLAVAETEDQKAAVARAVEALRADYVTAYRRLMGVRANTYSAYVAGRSGLNSRQANRSNSALDKAMEAFSEWQTAASGRVRRAALDARTDDQKQADQQAREQTEADKAQRREDADRSLIRKILTWKKGGEAVPIGKSATLSGVNLGRDGYPTSVNLKPNDGATLTSDKFDLAALFRRDGMSVPDSRRRVRELVDAVRAEDAAQTSGQDAAPAAPISDFGEKLEGARKDMPPSLKEEVSDEKIASLPLSKIWPSDAHESIEDDAAAALVFAARQEIPAKPRVPSRVRAWVSKVKTYRTLVKDLGKNSLERIEQLSTEKGFHSLGPFFAKVRLLSQLPRDTWSRVERVEEYPNAIRYEKDGSKTAVAFSSVTIDGKSRRFEGVGKIGPDEVQAVKEMLGTAAPKKDGLTAQDFEVRGTAKTGYKINRKGDSEYRSLKIFTGEDAAKKALAWRDEHTAELEAAWEAVKARDNVSKAEVRRDENRERTGENRRNGRDVTAQMFTDAFGFRGAQFGNWVGQGADAKSRQGMLNDAYDALLDLSDILGIPSRAISLNGTLGLSFGARGSGRAAAHFEPSNLVINLTKTRGAGSLAHEWFHALDNYFSRMRGGEVAFTGDNNAYRQNNFVTYKPEAAWGKAPITPYTNFMRGGQLRERLQRLPGFTYDANKTLAENAKAAGFERDPNHKDGVRPQVEKAFADLVQALNESPMAKRASSLDKAADGYWGRIIERGARSFENYVISKMAQRGWSNDFLANIRSFDEWMAMGKNAERYPYLKPEEDAPVVAAFDKLFETVETKEDDTGNVVMFSRSGAQSANANDQTSRSWYDRFVSLLPDAYRNDPHRREPLPAEDWNVQRAAEVHRKVEAINRQLRGENDRKGYGPISIDGLGNLQVSALQVSRDDLNGPIKALAKELGAGIAITNVRTGDIQALQDSGFVPETSLAPVADRIMGRPFDDPANRYAADARAYGTIMTYQPRGFPAVLFARDAATQSSGQPLRTPAATIRAAITKAYGNLLGQLESKGLVTLTQTEDEAIEAAAQARAAKTGQSVERERDRLQASIRGEADELSMSIYSDEAGKIERALDAMGLQVSTEGSRISQSTYVIVESPEYTQTEGESGSVLKIRVSDHRLPGGYQQPDFEVQVGNAHHGVDMADAAGAWFDAVSWVGRRFGVEPKGAAKRQIAAAAEKEAKAKQAAVAAADQQRDRLETSKVRLQAWLQSLPDEALWGNARRGGWVAVLDGKMIGRFDGETATGEGQPWYGGPYPVEAQKNLQPVRESLRASLMGSVSNSVATDDLDIRRSANGAIQGFFDPQTGQSFLVADNLTAEAAPGVLMHEVGIHMAADGSMKALFNRAAMMLKMQRGNPFMKAVQARMDAAGETSGEEAAAYIAEAYENDRANAPASVQRWLADLLAAVKAWMFKKGIIGADRLTVADIAAVARANARSMARDGGATGGQGFGTAFSRAPAGDQTQTEAFKRWFKDSKVVDAEGKPLVVYHGTNQSFDTFDASKADSATGQSEGAFWFASSPAVSERFGNATMPVYLSAVNLFEVTPQSVRSLFPGLFGGPQVVVAGGRAAVADVNREVVLDGRPVSVFDALEQGRAEAVMDPGLRKRAMAAAKKAGADGVVFRGFYDASDTASDIFAVFRPEQIKSAIGNNGNFDPADGRIDHFGANRPAKDGTPTDRAVMDMAREGKSAQDILRLIAGTSRSRFNRQVARLLLRTGVAPKVEALAADGLGKDKRGFNLLAKYSRDSNTISLTEGAGYMAEQIMLHELIHAATLRALDRKGLASLQMKRLFAHVQKQGVLDGTYGMKNVGEFTSEAFTNPDFQRELRKIKGMQDGGAIKTAWDGFVRILRSILGLPNDSHDALSQALQIGVGVMRDQYRMGNRGERGGHNAYMAARNVAGQDSASDDSDAYFGMADARAMKDGALAKSVGDGLRAITQTNIKQLGKHKLTDWLNIGLQFLGRRQLVDIYGDLLPLAEYNRLVQQMEADKNEGGAEADQLVTRWAKLSDETKLADLMHDATLAQIDPDKPYADGDDKAVYMMLQGRFKTLSDDAKAVYRATRDAYRAHHAKVRSAIKERIERSEIKGERKAALLKQMDDEFFKAIKGVYFPLARFGQYAVTVKGPEGKVESVSRAETKAEAEALRSNLLAAFPRDKGFTVGRVMLSKDFIADRDAVGRGFMTELYQVLDKQDIDAAQRAELEDTLGQLYLSSLPDLSWAKHGIHRKGTPGFSQDARRAFAQNMFHGARYLAKLRYSDLMQDELAAMQKHVDDWREVEDFDQNSAQRVVDEMNKRHESLMNPKSNPLSTALTSLGFVFHLGMSPASAMVNLSQTALVAYPIMGAKWGFNKASAALLKASKEAAAGKNDITGSLNADERAAYDEAVRAGTIDVTMAHDLAGIAQGEDAGVMWKIRPVMRWASFLFHNAERFNRQVTFVAAYRLARDAGANHKVAFDQATKATYDGHFDYGAANRPRIMQGNVAKVLLLFKQYGQNMVYTLSRNAYQSIKGTDAEKAEARKALAGLLTSHAMAAGVLGLPMVTTLLAAASMIGGDDDEPWDAKVALQNMLADAFGQKPAEVLAHGLSRLTPWDISGRVGLDRLIFPDVQEGLEGQRLAESAMAAALGPVAGIGVNVLKGAQHMSEGRYAIGLEAMLPSALRAPVKALRYAEEGVQDKSGISILDEVSPAAVAGQALGFSPSAARNAQDGKSAILAHDRALGERRQELLTKIARATMAKDEEAKAEAREEIKRFNEKNPGRRINPNHIMASVHGRQKRINQAQDGVYLPRNRREAMEVGRFALAESE